MKFVFSIVGRHLAKPWIIVAPMNGGINNPKFAAAVINAGGIGSFGFTYHSPNAIAKDILDTRSLAPKGIINANFFVYGKIDDPSDRDFSAASAALMGRFTESDLKLKKPVAPYHHNLSSQLEAVWEHRPDILTFHFGIPDRTILAEARRLGIAVGITATSPEEAMAIQESGANFVVAQGIEAGGHRGTFNTASSTDTRMPTWELVSELHHQVDFTLPIVAAGGVMTGTNIHSMIRLGASAVQMGTAFLPCTESTASAAHKRYMLQEPARDTVLTTAFSGRPARGIRNQFITQMAGAPVLPFPLQNTLTSGLRAAAVQRDDGEMQSLWVGSAYARARERYGGHYGGGGGSGEGGEGSGGCDITAYPSAGELIAQLHREYESARRPVRASAATNQVVSQR